jgi:hypothetical protein
MSSEDNVHHSLKTKFGNHTDRDWGDLQFL